MWQPDLPWRRILGLAQTLLKAPGQAQGAIAQDPPKNHILGQLVERSIRQVVARSGCALNNLLDLFFKLGARHHHAATTRGADRTDVGAQPHQAPFVPTTRVGLAQTHDVV